MFLPSNSAGSSYPSMRAAEGFEKRQVPSESQPQIASAAELSIRRIRSSLLSRASSACIRFELSSEGGMVDCGCSGPGTRRNALTQRHQSVGTLPLSILISLYTDAVRYGRGAAVPGPCERRNDYISYPVNKNAASTLRPSSLELGRNIDEKSTLYFWEGKGSDRGKPQRTYREQTNGIRAALGPVPHCVTGKLLYEDSSSVIVSGSSLQNASSANEVIHAVRPRRVKTRPALCFARR
jgi:hypothetical protein